MIKYKHKNMKVRERFFSRSGERYKTEYHLVIKSDGQLELEPCGQTDLQAFIDSFEPSVNLDNILKRFKNGDEEALERAKAFYADISGLPVKLQDIVQLNISGEEFFNTLPVDVKNQLGDNYRDFLFNPEKLIKVLEQREQKYVEPEQKEKLQKMQMQDAVKEVTADEQS